MELIITKKIGNKSYPFYVSGNNFFEVMLESQKLSFRDVKGCGLCQSDNLYPRAYVTKEDHYKYVKIICADCGGSITFGQTKDDPDVFYLRRTETGAYDWQEKPETKNTKKKDDGVPF